MHAWTLHCLTGTYSYDVSRWFSLSYSLTSSPAGRKQMLSFLSSAAPHSWWHGSGESERIHRTVHFVGLESSFCFLWSVINLLMWSRLISVSVHSCQFWQHRIAPPPPPLPQLLFLSHTHTHTHTPAPSPPSFSLPLPVSLLFFPPHIPFSFSACVRVCWVLSQPMVPIFLSQEPLPCGNCTCSSSACDPQTDLAGNASSPRHTCLTQVMCNAFVHPRSNCIWKNLKLIAIFVTDHRYPSKMAVSCWRHCDQTRSKLATRSHLKIMDVGWGPERGRRTHGRRWFHVRT